jgi:fructoselysine-6-phosphate deglycase
MARPAYNDRAPDGGGTAWAYADLVKRSRHVASRTLEEPLSWNASLLRPDVAEAVAALRVAGLREPVLVRLRRAREGEMARSPTSTEDSMLNFDEPRFCSIQKGALALAAPIHETFGRLLDGRSDNLYFLGVGGAGVLMLPAAQLLQRTTVFPVRLERAAELVAMGDAGLGARSIVVLPSLSGTTREALEVLELAHAAGAQVVALTAHGDSPIAVGADVAFVNFAEDDTSSESFYLQSLLIALSVQHWLGVLPRYDSILRELELLPSLLLEAKRQFESRARDVAEAIAAAPYHILSGAGSTWAEAWYYGTCILEEMQWIRTRPIHASDFFHGTLELVDKDVSLILLKGEDATRTLVERVERFAATVSDRVLVIDAAEVSLPGISDDVRALISPVVISTLLERVSAHLEQIRDHPLTTRRYYKRVAY